jgi:ZIP family zinc transporter
MGQLATIALVSWLAGIAAFVGGVLAKIEGSAEAEGKREIIHGIVAFGGGILVAAVAFALVPEGMASSRPAFLPSLSAQAG